MPLPRPQPELILADETMPADMIPSRQCADDPEPTAKPRGRESALPSLAQSAILLAFAGLSTGLGLWVLRADSLVRPYLQSNQITRLGRTFILADMFGFMLAFWAAALLYLVARGPKGVCVVNRVAWIVSPLIPVGLTPMLLDWQLWRDHDMTFLVLATLVGLGMRAFVGRALQQRPLMLLPERYRTPFAGFPLSMKWRRRLPLLTVIGMVAVYAAYFSYRTIEYHWNLRTSSFDLGLEENLIWNALHGTRILFKSSPFAGPTGTHFGNHVTFFAYVIAPLYWFCQRAEMLLVLQSMLIGGAAIPLFLFARRYLGDGYAAFVALLYLLNPAVHGTNLYDYHYLPLGPFFLWLSLYALESRRTVLSIIAILLTLSVREDVAGGLAVIGGYLLLSGRRPLAGIVVMAIGGGYLVLMKLVLMPMVAGGESFLSIYQGMTPQGENTFGGVLKTAIANPAFTVTSLLETKKIVYFLQIVTPLAFVPFRRPIGLWCALPGLLFTLLSTGYNPVIELGFQYPAHWTSFMFVALVANLAWMSRPSHWGDTEGRIRRGAWAAALAVSTLLVSHQYGVAFQSEIAHAGFGSAKFGTTEMDRVLRRDLAKLIALLPPRAKVCSSEKIVPQISNRPDAYTLRVGVYDAEYLILDMRGFTSEERTNARKAITDDKFGVVEMQGSFVLLKRGYESSRTTEILNRIH